MEDTFNLSVVAPQKRAYALDALRGLAILAMTFSGLIPFHVLPAWMYHSQEPPPTHAYNANLSGLTWVDLVFPIFLFSMGAAIPLALSRRISKGWSTKKILFSILKRGFLLEAFAIFLQHIRPYRLSSNPDTKTWIIALLGFILLFFMFARLPDTLSPSLRKFITVGAWIGAIILLAFLRYPDGSGFSINRSDIIIVLLASSAIFGSIVWYFTKNNLLLRLGLLGLLLALRLSASADGWIASVWSFSPVPWIFKFEYLSYLFLVIPGTIAGDLFLNSTQNKVQENNNSDCDDTNYLLEWNRRKFLIIVFSAFITCLIILIGLQSRLGLETTLIYIAILICSWYLFKNPVTATEYLISKLYQWGNYWLIFGLLFEPYEGGVKKDPPSMSYYFIGAGIAVLLLIVFTIVIDVFDQRWLQLLIENGQNPMIGYVVVANFIWPVLNLTGLYQWISKNTKSTELGIIRAIIYTLLSALIVSFITKKKLFWKN